jgi:hypothetical protein
MSTQANLLAFGPFRESIAQHLEYPADCYSDVPEGTPVMSELLFTSTRDSSEALASAIGISLYDVAKHCNVQITRKTFAILRQLAHEDDAILPSHIDALDALQRAGFTFHFRLDC